MNYRQLGWVRCVHAQPWQPAGANDEQDMRKMRPGAMPLRGRN